MSMGHYTSLVPRPSLTAFFAAVAKSVVFATAAKKSCEGRPGYEASIIQPSSICRRGCSAKSVCPMGGLKQKCLSQGLLQLYIVSLGRTKHKVSLC